MALYETNDDVTMDVFRLHTEKLMAPFINQFGGLSNERTSDTVGIESPPPTIGRVAVVGGGVSGLLLAMRLGKDHEVDVYEASNHVGGRLYTHKFKSGGEWDYFDVGAMRFPHTSIMKPTYDLFEELGIPLLEYNMFCKKSWLYYNNIRVRREDATGQDFGVGVSKGGNVPDEWVTIGVDELMRKVYGRFLAMLRQDYHKGHEYLMTFDDHSTRSLMAFVTLPAWTDPRTEEVFPEKPPYPKEVINWLETMTFSAGWFDRAFSETILELLAFAEGLKDVKWRCVKYGSQEITKKMEDILTNNAPFNKNVRIRTNSQVVRVEYQKEAGEMAVAWKSSPDQEGSESGYSQVVLAVSPQCMRYMDLSTCELDYGQRSSLLMLQPGPSIKVGMKFKRNWWADQGITGGQSATDRPVRTIVYPSHGGGKSTVLIASYCWTQDAATMGAWMQGAGSFDEERLKHVILSDLSAVHNIPLANLEADFEKMYAFDWTHNAKTMGAFAFFGPGQFSSLLHNLTRPAAQGRLHFAGEATSTCHAWVAGAIESAYRVLNQINPQLISTPRGPVLEGQEDAEVPPMMFSTNHALLQLAISAHLQRKEFYANQAN